MSNEAKPVPGAVQNGVRVNATGANNRGQSTAISTTNITDAGSADASPQLALSVPRMSNDAPIAVNDAKSGSRSQPVEEAHGAAAGGSDSKVDQSKALDAPKVTDKADAPEVIRDADGHVSPVALEARSSSTNPSPVAAQSIQQRTASNVSIATHEPEASASDSAPERDEIVAPEATDADAARTNAGEDVSRGATVPSSLNGSDEKPSSAGGSFEVTITKRMVSFASLSIAPDNPWGADIREDESYRHVLAMTASSASTPPLLVQARGNGWAIIGDPAAYIAWTKQEGFNQEALVAVEEVTGTATAILYHIGVLALGTRQFRFMRRARYSLSLCELDNAQGKEIAKKLDIHSSGTSRDLKAARLERQYPAFAHILANPSDAAVSYYSSILSYADEQAFPEKALAALAARAAKIAKKDQGLSTTAAKLALGIVKPSKPKGEPEMGFTSRPLEAAAGASSAALEQSADGTQLRLVLTYAVGTSTLEERAAEFQSWLATMPAPVAAAEPLPSPAQERRQ